MSRQLAIAILLFVTGSVLYCQTPLNERVLVVYKSNDSESLAVAKYYMAQRKIPEGNRCAIAPSSIEYLKQNEYESRVQAPVRKCIEAVGKQKVLYIVFSYHTPYVVFLANERGFALDSFVADLWDEYTGMGPGNELAGHPFFAVAQSQGSVYPPAIPFAAYRDQPRAANIYAVWRLDAATAQLAKGLVDKAIYAEAKGLSGKGCFDLQFGPAEQVVDYSSGSGDWDIHQAAEFARRAGFEVVEDTTKAEFGTAPAPLRCDNAALFAGWYDLGHYNDAFTWNPGAIGFHLDSASATNPRGPGNWSGTAVMKGITITSGAAAEPYLEGLAHPDQVFLDLFLGANAGDALLRSTRWLKWMILNIGDPLYRPFPKGVASLMNSTRTEGMLALIPQSVIGGDAVSGIAALIRPAGEGGVVVSLTSDSLAVKVPRNVTIPANANNARFPILTQLVNGDPAVARISMAAGEVRRSNTLVVHPCMQPLTLSPAKVTGGKAVTGTVVLSRSAPAAGTTVELAADNQSLVSLPAQVKVPPGSSRATFEIATRATGSDASVVVKASIGGCIRTASLTLTP